MLKHTLQYATGRRELHQAKWFFYIFIASLGMFFAGSLVTYLRVRYHSYYPATDAVPGSTYAMGPKFYAPMQVPIAFWLSSLVLVLHSFLMQRAVNSVRREHQIEFRKYLLFSWWSAMLFALVQAIGMGSLWVKHFAENYDGSTKVFGMSFVLSFLHALHVLGGLIFLAYVIYRAFRGRYDHERHWAVDNCAGYWHFLGIVWMAMLVTFYLSG